MASSVFGLIVRELILQFARAQSERSHVSVSLSRTAANTK